MHLGRFFAVLIPVLLLSASAAAQKSVYSFSFENENRLPAMEYRIDMEEISSSYQTVGNVLTTQITGFGSGPVEQHSYSFISDIRVVDAVRFMEYYLKDQLLGEETDSTRAVEMSVIYFHERNRFNAGSVLGVLTFGLGILFGIPHSTLVTDVELEARFFRGDDPLAVHRGVGRGRKPMTLYTTSGRKAHQRALKKALEDLNSGVMSDPALRPVTAP